MYRLMVIYIPTGEMGKWEKTFISEGKSSSNYLIHIHSPMEKMYFLQAMVTPIAHMTVDALECILLHCGCLEQIMSCACLCFSRGRPCSLHDYECSSQSEGLGLLPSLKFMLSC